jgi:hypothetical protein
MSHIVKVLLTVDTEIWPRSGESMEGGLAEAMHRDFYGTTPAGDYGIPFQLTTLSDHRLKAVFHVESLFASAAGPTYLKEMVDVIREGNQEIQLHIHTEWIPRMATPLFKQRRSENMKDYTDEEQCVIIARAVENLGECGVTDLNAFRAGNYGADIATLRSLKRNRIKYDTSYNFCYLHTDCGIRTDAPLVQSEMIEGIWEVPITFFCDWPGHYRHVQITACSFAELRALLLSAWKRKFTTFVIVSHSFELLKNRKVPGKGLVPDSTAVSRFVRLCAFLSENRDKFQTIGFHDLHDDDLGSKAGLPPLRSNIMRTAGRITEQAVRRAF